LRVSSPCPEALATILNDEERQGRLRCENGRWHLVPAAFPADLLEALRVIG
jgi:hypothetical protein